MVVRAGRGRLRRNARRCWAGPLRLNTENPRDPVQPLGYAALGAQKNHYGLYLMCLYAKSEHESWFRDEFRKGNCKYQVLKNTLVKIAIKGSRIEPISKLLEGPTAVIWSTESPSLPAKIATKNSASATMMAALPQSRTRRRQWPRFLAVTEPPVFCEPAQ